MKINPMSNVTSEGVVVPSLVPFGTGLIHLNKSNFILQHSNLHLVFQYRRRNAPSSNNTPQHIDFSFVTRHTLFLT